MIEDEKMYGRVSNPPVPVTIDAGHTSIPMNRRVPIGVLLSGGGTNLQAIIDAIEQDRLDADIRTVVSNRETAYGIIRARNHGIPTTVINHRGHASREAYDRVAGGPSQGAGRGVGRASRIHEAAVTASSSKASPTAS